MKSLKEVGARSFKGFACLALACAATCAQAKPQQMGWFQERSEAVRADAAPAPLVLTLDACGGHFDWELAHWIVDRKIQATIFVTKIFIEANPEAVAFMKTRPDSFDIQNHGARHDADIVASSGKLWGVPLAGSAAAADKEIAEGAAAIKAAFGSEPTVYRGATAIYDAQGVGEATRLGFEIGGYAVSMDDGGTLSARAIMQRALSAKPGDVLIGHINRPAKRNGESIARALDAAIAKGATLESWAQARAAGSIAHAQAPLRGPKA